MSHLRSPSVHHLGLQPLDLESFAGSRRRNRKSGFRGSCARPQLELFNRHCEALTDEYALASMHTSAAAVDIRPAADRMIVELSSGDSLTARNVVLALGSPAPFRPAEFSQAPHVLDPEWQLPFDGSGATVIGGGITAVQLALALSDDGASVELVTRHPIRTAAFDSDSCWIGPACMARFDSEPSYEKRRAIIREARNYGTVPTDVKRALVRARNAGRIHIRQVNDLASVAGRDRVVLATGFAACRPGGALLDRLVEGISLSVAPCGFPIPTRKLRWHERLWVTGGLAELELGPTARNIVGARRAADRIVFAGRQERRRVA